MAEFSSKGKTRCKLRVKYSNSACCHCAAVCKQLKKKCTKRCRNHFAHDLYAVHVHINFHTLQETHIWKNIFFHSNSHIWPIQLNLNIIEIYSYLEIYIIFLDVGPQTFGPATNIKKGHSSLALLAKGSKCSFVYSEEDVNMKSP